MNELEIEKENHHHWVEGWIAGINAAKERVLFTQQRILDLSTHTEIENLLKNLDMDKKNALFEKPKHRTLISYGNP